MNHSMRVLGAAVFALGIASGEVQAQEDQGGNAPLKETSAQYHHMPRVYSTHVLDQCDVRAVPTREVENAASDLATRLREAYVVTDEEKRAFEEKNARQKYEEAISGPLSSEKIAAIGERINEMLKIPAGDLSSSEVKRLEKDLESLQNAAGAFLSDGQVDTNKLIGNMNVEQTIRLGDAQVAVENSPITCDKQSLETFAKHGSLNTNSYRTIPTDPYYDKMPSSWNTKYIEPYPQTTPAALAQRVIAIEKDFEALEGSVKTINAYFENQY